MRPPRTVPALLLVTLAVVACMCAHGDRPGTPPPPARSAAATDLLAFLASLPSRPDKRLISGQHVASTARMSMERYEAFAAEHGPLGPHLAAIHAKTGEWPGLLGGDYFEAEGSPPDWKVANRILAAHAAAGGIVTLSTHMRNPATLGNAWDDDLSLPQVLDPGHPVGAQWREDLAVIADGLEDLERQGIVVLYRPFHEMNGDWFWWSRGSPDEFVALWRELHRYLIIKRGLRNLLFVYAPSELGRSGYLTRYPGDDDVDIVGIDYYGADPASADKKGMDPKGYDQLVGTGKPFGLTEFGPFHGKPPRGFDLDRDYDYTQLVQAIRNRFPKAVFWQSWAGPWGLDRHKNVEVLLRDPWVLNRDDLPKALAKPGSP